MIKIEIAAASVSELRKALLDLAGGYETRVGDPGGAPSPGSPAEEGRDGDGAPAPALNKDGSVPKRRGRPPKSAPGAPTASSSERQEGSPESAAPVSTSPVTEAIADPSTRGGPVVQSQPAESTAAATAPAAAGEGSTPVDPVAATPITLDEVRDLLHKVAARDNGKGIRDATAILNKHGYDMIKKVQPKDFATMAAKCREILGG